MVPGDGGGATQAAGTHSSRKAGGGLDQGYFAGYMVGLQLPFHELGFLWGWSLTHRRLWTVHLPLPSIGYYYLFHF